MNILDDLDNRFVTFTFAKADGSERTMTATRCLHLIPDDQHPSGGGKPKLDDTIRVYELNVGWRSFKPSTLIKHD